MGSVDDTYEPVALLAVSCLTDRPSARSQNMDEPVLGKWQGRRPLPAQSLDQGSAYPAIYPLWTGKTRVGGGGGEKMR